MASYPSLWVFCAATVAASLLAGPTRAQETRLEIATAPEPLVIRRIISLEESAITVRTADQDRTIPRDELIELSLPTPPARELKGNDVLVLTSGDRLQVANVTSAEDAVTATLRAAPAVRLSIPLEYTRGLIRLAKGVPGWRERLPVADDSAVDLVLLRNSDRIRGEFTGLTDDALAIKTASGASTIDPEDLRAIAFSPDLLAKRHTEKRHVVVQFRDGSFWTADSVTRPAGEPAWFVTVGSDRWTIPGEGIVRVAFYSDSATSLATLPPRSRKRTPFLPDAAPSGQEAPPPAPGEEEPVTTIGGAPVPRGLEGPGRTEWTFSLDGTWSEFRGTLEIPDSAGDGGTATFRVAVDGKLVLESGLVSAAAGPRRIAPVAIQGAKTLTLTIDYGEFWDVRNRGVWIDPRLVRRPQPPAKR